MLRALALVASLGCVACPPATPGEGEGEGDPIGEGEGEGDPPRPSIAINELRCANEVIELFNTGAAAVDLGALLVSDAGAAGANRQALAGTLAAGAFLDVPLAFGLACAGASVDLLLAADGSMVDAMTAPAMASDQSWGRLPDGNGAPALNTPTPAAANQAWRDASDLVFAPTSAPMVVRLTVGAAEQQALEDQPYLYVAATFQATVDEDGTSVTDAPLQVGVRIKGKLGSFRGCPFSCGEKSAFKIDINRAVVDQRWRRIEKLNLNNQVQDASRTHEWLSYEIFREVGVPAPRTGYAQLIVNDEDYGLYAVVEDHDDPFLDNHWPQGTLALYEGEYGQDLFPGTADDFDVDVGSDTDRGPLVALIDAVDAAPVVGFYDAMADQLDWDEVLHALATEIFVGHWDGYAPTRNNYFLHVDDNQRWTIIPWGTDQTFDYPWPLYEGAGLLFERCRADPTCLDAYSAALGDVAAATLARDFPTELRALAERLQPWADGDPRASPTDLSGYAEAALAFLEARGREVAEEVVCQGGAADIDGDGQACSLDCDESDDRRFVGGDDSCPGGAADGVDNDCNQLVDDGAGCPDCIDQVVGASGYSFCRAPRPYDGAAANCAARGGVLAMVSTQGEWDQVYQAATQVMGMADTWIGLDDRVQEGEFRWADGSALGFDAWAPGEPNDYQSAEDCAEARPDGLWNDLFCDAALPSICEL